MRRVGNVLWRLLVKIQCLHRRTLGRLPRMTAEDWDFVAGQGGIPVRHLVCPRCLKSHGLRTAACPACGYACWIVPEIDAPSAVTVRLDTLPVGERERIAEGFWTGS